MRLIWYNKIMDRGVFMEREVRFIRLKLDIIFKRMFGTEENYDLLAALISALLGKH